MGHKSAPNARYEHLRTNLPLGTTDRNGGSMWSAFCVRWLKNAPSGTSYADRHKRHDSSTMASNRNIPPRHVQHRADLWHELERCDRSLTSRRTYYRATKIPIWSGHSRRSCLIHKDRGYPPLADPRAHPTRSTNRRSSRDRSFRLGAARTSPGLR
jgi:hypothetical protein